MEQVEAYVDAIRHHAELDAIAAELNGRPRKTLEFMTPSEKFMTPSEKFAEALR